MGKATSFERKRTKAPSQNLINIIISDCFVFGQEKILDLDSSMNSFVGCCSLGTGHLDSFINILWKYKIISITPK